VVTRADQEGRRASGPAVLADGVRRYRRGVDLYLDHAASTPPRPEARAALASWLDAANASATHTAGRRARTAVEEAREQVAEALHCSPHEVVFTSGGTEADNLAVKGVAWAARERRRAIPHLVTTAVEHPAVLEPARWLADRGDVTLSVVPPGGDGRIDVARVLDAVGPETVLVSVMAANNELGSVNDVGALAHALGEHEVALHTDAVQAIATLDVDVEAWGVGALALSAHKFGGPQGVGVAVLRRGLPVEPLTHGGGQDRGVRSGTFAAGLDAACAAALTAAVADRPVLRSRLAAATERMAAALTSVPGVHRNGPADPAGRLASHLHLSLADVDPAALSLGLDRVGVAASSGAACGAGAATASPVLEATGITGTPLRLSLGWDTTEAQVDEATERLTGLFEELLDATARPGHRAAATGR
jgi:cysteine desulfurase